MTSVLRNVASMLQNLAGTAMILGAVSLFVAAVRGAPAPPTVEGRLMQLTFMVPALGMMVTGGLFIVAGAIHMPELERCSNCSAWSSLRPARRRAPGALVWS